MKHIILLVTFLFFFKLVVGQQTKDSIKNNKAPLTYANVTTATGQQSKDKIKPNEVEAIHPNISINLPDALQIKMVSEKPDNETFLNKNMPWIVALLIGILSALVNFWVSHRLRQSNERNLQRQIENSKEIALTQFKATIATKNRQEWINELRKTISELVSYAASLVVVKKINTGINDEYIMKTIEPIVFCSAKIELLLNDQKTEQNDLIQKADKLMKVCNEPINKIDTKAVDTAINDVISSARTLFAIHWKKIKELK